MEEGKRIKILKTSMGEFEIILPAKPSTQEDINRFYRFIAELQIENYYKKQALQII